MDITKIISGLSSSQKTIVTILAAHPKGLLSTELTQKTGISNKASIVGSESFKKHLAENNLELYLERRSKQWLWVLRSIPENKE